jgi:PKD repeat protein
MKSKTALNMLLSLLLISMMSVGFYAYSEGLTSTGNITTASSGPFPTNRPVLFAYPYVIEQDVGVDFTVSVKIFNLTDTTYTDSQNKVYPLGNLYGVGMNFTWDPNVLEYVSHTVKIPYEDWAPDGVLYYPTTVWEDNLNLDAGWYKMAYSSQSPAPVFNNPGQNNTVFEFTFRAKHQGSCDLRLTQVALPGKNVGDRVYHEGYAAATGRSAVFTSPGLPVAKFSVWPPDLRARVNESVMFDASGSYDTDGTITDYMWNFGDGVNGTGQIINHTYTSTGTCKVILKVRDNEGLESLPVEKILIIEGGVHPVANFTYWPSDPRENQVVTFDASSSYDPDGFNISLTWNFGDGATGTGIMTYHTYQTTDTYLVTLIVTDFEGLTDAITHAVTVRPGIHDVAILSVAAYPTNITSEQTVWIDVLVANEGTAYETFNVTVYCDDTLIGKTVCWRNPGESYWIGFAWVTAGVAEGVYTVRAEASIVPGETDLADNVYVDGNVTVMPAIHDVAILSVAAYPTSIMSGQTVWIDVLVANEGTAYEIFDVTVYRDDTPMWKSMRWMSPGESYWIGFAWVTAGVAEGVYTVRAEASIVPGETDLADNVYVDGNVTVILPKISLSPASGPVGTKVKVEGHWFPSNAGGYLTFDDQLIGLVFVDRNGNLSAEFNVPLSEAGSHVVKVVLSYYSSALTDAKATFTVSQVAPLDVNIDVGDIYFKGETVEFYLQTVFNGEAVDATSINPTLYLPDGRTQTLTWQRTAKGLYKIRYATNGKGSKTGTYNLVVEAGYTTETVDAHGTSIKAFLVKSTWEREMPRVAAFSIASLGLVSAMLVIWRRERNRLL